MSNLVIIGTIEAVPGRRAEVLAALQAHGARCLAEEPGTLQFEILVPRESESELLIYEVYANDAAFEMHRGGPSIARFRDKTAGMIARLDVTRCDFAPGQESGR